jgi:hypothetical protein
MVFMKHLSSLLLRLFICSFCWAGINPSFGQSTFKKNFLPGLMGSTHYAFPTSDGGLLFNSLFISDTTFTNVGFHLTQLNASGQPVSEATLNIDPFNSAEQSSLLTADGGMLITNKNKVVKLNQNFVPVWSKIIEIPNTTLGEFGTTCLQTADGGYLIATDARDAGSGYFGHHLAKLDASGNLSWSKAVLDSFFVNDLIENVTVQTSDGGYLSAGRAGPSYNRGFMLKTDVGGNLQWAKQMSQNLGNIDYLLPISGGNVLFGGTLSDSSGNYTILGRMNADGTIFWCRGLSNGFDKSVVQIKALNNGNYMALLNSGWDNAPGFTDTLRAAVLMSFDSNGNILNTQQILGINPSSFASTNDGGFYVLGNAYVSSNNQVIGIGNCVIRTNASLSYGCGNADAYTVNVSTVNVPMVTMSVYSATGIFNLINNSPAVNAGPYSMIENCGTIEQNPLSLEETKSTGNTMRAFPNPGKGLFVLTDAANTPLPQGTQWTMFDLSGRAVQTGVIVEQGSVDTGNPLPGLYFIRVTMNNISTAVMPVTIVH